MTPAPSRRSLALAGFAGLGVAALAGCSPEADTVDTSAEYADGEYSATGEYQAPSGTESLDVTITLEDDIVTDVDVVGNATDPNATSFQSQFASGIAGEVVGKDIDTLDVSRVAGSSLSSGGFNAALETIKAEALSS